MHLNFRSVSTIYKLILLGAVLYGIYLSLFRGVDYGLHPLNFFTIQSNILVALALLYFLLVRRLNRLRAVIRGSVMLSILITALTFHTMLVPYYPEFFGEGLDLRAHLTHTLVPAGFILDWLFFDPKNQMRFTDIRYWVIYPLLYWLINVIRGAFTGVYPYFFMDIGAIGFDAALLWLLSLTLFFILVGLLIIRIDTSNRLWSGVTGKS